MKKSMLSLIFVILIKEIFTFVGVSTISHFTSTKSNMIIHYTLISNASDTAFVAMFDTDSTQKIRSFNNISTGSWNGPKNFYQKTKKFLTNYVTFYQPNYVIGISYQSLNFTLFYNTSQFINTYSINETICDIVLSSSQSIVIEVSTSGNIYWVKSTDFPSANYKNLLMSGVSGMSKAVLSSNGTLVAIGGSNDSRLFLVDLVSKNIIHTYTLNGNDTRFIVWNGDDSKIYVATSRQGLIFELLTTSPYNITQIRYQLNNSVTVNSFEFYAEYNELIVFTYCNNYNNISIYSYMLSTMKLGHKQSYIDNLTITGSASYGSSKLYSEWSNLQIYVKKVLFNCSTGSYYDQCLGKCNVCAANCTNCTAQGCGTCPANATAIIVPNVVIQNNTATINTTTFNITSNTTVNTTNQTIVQPINQTITPVPQQNDQKNAPLYKNFGSLLGGTINSSTLSTLNQVPGTRGLLKPIFTFFGNLDDFWLYIYHPRNYQFVMNQTFSCIMQLEREKWNTIPYQQLWGFLGLNTTQLQNQITFKQQFTSAKFMEIQGNSSEFLITTVNFYFSNLFLIIILFLVYRFIFFLLFKFKISIFFRKYSFWPTLIVLLLDGNLQISAYLTFFEIKWLFTSNIVHKTLTVWVITNFFFMLLFSVACYFIFKYLYNGLAKYFYENTSVSNIGALYLLAQIGLRNILLGLVHSLNFELYESKIMVLLSVEMCFLLFGVKVISMKGAFESKLSVWINLTATFTRMIIIGIFLIEQDVVENEITLMSPIFAMFIMIYMGLGVLNMLIELIKLAWQLTSLFRQKRQSVKAQNNKEQFTLLFGKDTRNNKKSLRISDSQHVKIYYSGKLQQSNLKDKKYKRKVINNYENDVLFKSKGSQKTQIPIISQDSISMIKLIDSRQSLNSKQKSWTKQTSMKSHLNYNSYQKIARPKKILKVKFQTQNINTQIKPTNLKKQQINQQQQYSQLNNNILFPINNASPKNVINLRNFIRNRRRR